MNTTDHIYIKKRIWVFALCFMAFSVLLMPLGECYTFHNPKPTLLVHSQLSPEVVMPGDTAVLTIEIENGASDYVVHYQAEDFTLSTPINSTSLRGFDGISVTSKDYKEIGMIGPGDKVPLYYTIRVDDDLPDGTYFLNFSLEGGYDLQKINRKIPITVDSSSVSLSQADASSQSTISLNVANPRQNTLNGVTVIATADGLDLYPDEYYIGTMDADEVFTINFKVSNDNSSLGTNNRPGTNSGINVDFITRFKNGDTWHTSSPYNITYRTQEPAKETNWLVPSLVILAIGAGGIFLLWKRRSSKNNNNKVTKKAT